jgi:hypothetical protein
MTAPRVLGPVAAAMIVATAACAPFRIPATLDPVAADRAIEATAPDRPLHVVFAWQALEGDARFTGQGVARIQDPYRARLDLFGPRGDTYLSAALVGAELRLPPGVAAVPIPPPALLWAVLGVVAPPPGARLAGTRERGATLELYYETDDGVLVYVLEGERVRSARLEASRRRPRVDLSGQALHGLPAQAVYRDAAAAVELMLNLERADEVDPFPPEIWQPGR